MTEPVAIASKIIISTATVSGAVNGVLTGSDLEGPVTFSVDPLNEPAHGTVTVNEDGTFTYSRDPSYSGQDSFMFIVTDSDGDKATAMVSIEISENAPKNIDGTNGNDILLAGKKGNVIHGGDGVDYIVGGSGGDRLYGGEGDDLMETRGGGGKTYGEGGNDTLIGYEGNQTLDGGSGDDTLDGGSGSDTLIGGADDDTYIVSETGDDAVEAANEGIDTVKASVTYTLGANVEKLILTGTGNINGTGNGLANTLVGNSGNNVLDGGAGADRLEGGAGDDTYVVDDQGDVVVEEADAGNDTVQASLSTTLGAHVENLVLTGTAGIDGTGNDLDNAITGNSGNNALNGAGGDDWLDGGAGSDAIDGGDGDDTVVFSGQASNYVISQNDDGSLTVTDLTTNDVDLLTSVEHLRFAGGLELSPPTVDHGIVDQSLAEDTPWTFQVPEGTFADADGDTLTYSATRGNGAALPSWLSFDPATGTFSGTPPKDWTGSISLKVTASDDRFSASSTFVLDLTAVNDKPQAVDDVVTTTEQTPVSFDVRTNDVDADSDTLVITQVNGAAISVGNSVAVTGGVVSLGNDGKLTFSPANNFNGPSSFTYTVSDGQGGTSTGTVDLTVEGINDAPSGLTLSGDTVREAAANNTVVGTLSAPDVDSADLTYTLVDSAGGRFGILGNQLVVKDGLQLDYEQASSHSVEVQVSDGQGGVFTKTFTLTLTDLSPEIITGDARANTFVAGRGNDVLNGGIGNDTLVGGVGKDRLVGAAGHDDIWGGKGKDVLKGASGADDFIFASVKDSGASAAKWDTIKGFGGKDHVDLHLIDAIKGGANDAFHLDTDGSFSAGEIRYTESKAGMLLEMNVDGDAAAEMAIFLKGFHGTLNNGDFVF